MDEKTEELRELFIDVTDAETVTETQEDARGSLVTDGESTERLVDIISRMRDRYEFGTSLSDGDLAAVIEGFYTGESDGAIADRLDVSRRTVVRARLDLHLVRDNDGDAPFDLAELRQSLADGDTTGDIGDRFGVSESTVRRYRRVVEARREASRVSDRFRSEFEDVLVDAGLDEQLTANIADDGLEEATDGMETNVSF